jgi:hypothetical protein
VAEILTAMQTHEVLPAEARNYLMALTGLLGSLTQEHRMAERLYKLVLYGCQMSEKVSARAKVAAEATEQYHEMQTAKDAINLCEQGIMSLKVFLRSLDNEMSLAGR